MAHRKDLATGDDLKESIAHLDQLSARISRLLTGGAQTGSGRRV